MRSTILIILVVLSKLLYSQNSIEYFQYWFDTDINQKHTSLITGETSTPTTQLVIETDELDFGLHLFNYRYCDSQGEWSVIQSSFFNKVPNFDASEVSMLAYEFWVDNQVAESIIVNSTNSQLSHNLDVNHLENGLHLFNYRIKDSRGRWSHTHSKFFVKTNAAHTNQNLVDSYEYWFNSAYENKNYVALENPINPLNLSAQIETPVLPVGDHVFSIRFKDIYGNWSEPKSTNFNVNSCYLQKAQKPTGEEIICSDVLETEFFTNKVNKAETYHWFILPDTAGEILISDTAATIIWTEAFIGQAQLFVYAANACGEAENSDTLVVERVALPDKPVIADTSFYEFCDTDSVILTAPEGFSYLWQDYSANQLFTATTSGEYFVRIQNESGCFAFSDTIIVETHETPNTPSIMAYGDTGFCMGDSVELGANNLPKETFYHVWTTGENTETIWVKTSGKYAHKLISEFGCESSFSDSVEVSVFENPEIPEITRVENTLTVSENYAYQWYQNLAPVAGLIPIDGATEQAYSPTEDGTYAVEVFTENSCSELSAPYDFIASNIMNYTSKPMHVFPNPNNGIFTIANPSDNKKIEIKISNTAGTIIYQEISSASQLKVDLSSFSGILIVSILCEQKQTTQKLIITN